MSHMNPLSVMRVFISILSNILWWVPITTIWYSFSRTLGSSVTLMLYSSFTSFASVGNTMMGYVLWRRGEGWRVYFKSYIIFFILGFFRFLTLGSFFRCLPLPFTRIYKKEFSNLHPSPFWRFFWWSESYGWRVVKALSCFVLNTFLHLDILRRVWLGTEKYELA